MENLSQSLKELCIEKSITLKELANLCEIPNSLIYDYVNNKKTPTVKNIVKIANYFNCSIDYLMGLTDDIKISTVKSINKSIFFVRYNQLLKSKNITNYEFCKHTNSSQSRYSKWKKGTMPYLDNLIKIAKYFDVSIDYLIGRSDD